jgi:hypothetical protein
MAPRRLAGAAHGAMASSAHQLAKTSGISNYENGEEKMANLICRRNVRRGGVAYQPTETA